MTARFLFQVTALPLMHLSFLFNLNPFTATFAFMAKGAKRSQIFFCVFFLRVLRLTQITLSTLNILIQDLAFYYGIVQSMSKQLPYFYLKTNLENAAYYRLCLS